MTVSLEEWKMFRDSIVYKELEEEWTERRNILLLDLESGSKEYGSDDMVRGRLNELKFITTAVRDRIELLEIEQEALKKSQEEST